MDGYWPEKSGENSPEILLLFFEMERSSDLLDTCFENEAVIWMELIWNGNGIIKKKLLKCKWNGCKNTGNLGHISTFVPF